MKQKAKSYPSKKFKKFTDSETKVLQQKIKTLITLNKENLRVNLENGVSFGYCDKSDAYEIYKDGFLFVAIYAATISSLSLIGILEIVIND